MTNDERTIATQFDAQRPRLRALAHRMLTSATEADDAVQEAWLRVSRAGTDDVHNLDGWLTTIVARICLDMLRARKARAEDPAIDAEPADDASTPEQRSLLADSVGLALLVVLETLSPNERLAFVLHDTFDLPFEEIAAIIGCSPAAARQLASRARRRVRGAPTDAGAEADLAQQRTVVEAFLTASRTGDLSGLLAVLDPNVVLRADAFAVAGSAARQVRGAPRIAPEINGADAVAQSFLGRAGGARLALIEGSIGAAWAPGGRVRAAFAMTVRNGKITGIELVADPERLRELGPALLDA